jgi:hypothetical protein
MNRLFSCFFSQSFWQNYSMTQAEEPAVRNIREGDGNVGTIRCQVRAMDLPEYSADDCSVLDMPTDRGQT